MPRAGFDHRVTGTPEHAWRVAGLDQFDTVFASATRLVVLAAHPDDETLGAGGLLAASARQVARIDVVIATDGEASHPTSPTHTPSRLANIRRAEVRAAVAVLAPNATVHHLGLPDGRLAQHEQQLRAALTRLVGPAGARLVTPWSADGHPDHEACGRAAAHLADTDELVEHWQYPIWFWHWGTPADAALSGGRFRRLEFTRADQAAKSAALAQHLSQHAPLSDQDGDEAILPAPILAHFERAFECFVVDPAASRSRYFDDLYSCSRDPWGLATRFYEQRKRDLVLASLPRRHFCRAFEPGCATGLLTERLLERADEVVAWDIADAAVQQASDRCRTRQTSLQLEDRRIPVDWPDGRFDLIVLSEVGYYCADLSMLTRRVLNSLTSDGVLLACHWAHPAKDHPHTAGEVHAAFDGELERTVHHVEADFRLDVWTRDGTSVAAAEGMV